MNEQNRKVLRHFNKLKIHDHILKSKFPTPYWIIVPPQLVAGYFIGSVHLCRMYNAGKTIDVGDVWPATRKDLSAVEWAHAVNSEAELKAALWG